MIPSPLAAQLQYIASLFHRYFTPSQTPSTQFPSHNRHIACPSQPSLPASTSSVDLIELSRSQDLTSCPLSSDWQTHSMSSSSITSHVPQSRNVLSHSPPRIFFYRHVGELSRESCLGLGVEVTNS